MNLWLSLLLSSALVAQDPPVVKLAADPFQIPASAAFQVFEAMRLKNGSGTIAPNQNLWEGADSIVNTPVSYANFTTVVTNSTSFNSNWFTGNETAGYRTVLTFIEQPPYVLIVEGDEGIIPSKIRF